MKTVGEILKTTREKRDLNLETVVAATKIKKEFLEAIENDNFHGVSSEVTLRGFIKNYAEFLGLSSKTVLAVFKRDFTPDKGKKIIPQTIVKPIDKKGIVWGPKLTMIIMVAIIFIILLTYLGYQYFSLIRAPFLEVTSPQDGKQVTQESIEIVGRTDADSVVTVNGNLVALSSQGEFRYQLDLFPGENKILIESQNKLNRKTSKEKTVFRLDK